jgi:hypothetical protein
MAVASDVLRRYVRSEWDPPTRYASESDEKYEKRAASGFDALLSRGKSELKARGIIGTDPNNRLFWWTGKPVWGVTETRAPRSEPLSPPPPPAPLPEGVTQQDVEDFTL